MSHDDPTTTNEPRTPEERAAIRNNRRNPMPVVVGDIPDEARQYARRVGKWVWIAFPSKPDPEIRECLVDIGFRWNPKRSAWQHSCGTGRSHKAPYDPRQKYGEVALDDSEA